MSVKSKLLEFLELNKGHSVSGESIAQSIQCTRAAVWKAVKALQDEGYKIEAVKNKGYRLTEENNVLSAEGIRAYLNSSDSYVKVYDEVGSTNQMAKQAAIQGIAGNGALIVSSSQTAGRGRRGREFYSPKGGLYFSIILKPMDTIQNSLILTTAAATAVYKAVKETCGIELDIKWVNDLFKDSYKVCGILTEAITDFESGMTEYVIVGIGLNIFQKKELLPDSLREVAGALYESEQEASAVDKNQLIAKTVNYLLEEMKQLKISDIYLEKNMIPGNMIEIFDGNRTRIARALEIGEDGSLLVEEMDGTQNRLIYGEISVYLQK